MEKLNNEPLKNKREVDMHLLDKQKMHFGNFLANARGSRVRGDMAYANNVNIRLLGDYENGESFPTKAEDVQALAEIYGVDPNELDAALQVSIEARREQSDARKKSKPFKNKDTELYGPGSSGHRVSSMTGHRRKTIR